MSTFDAADLQGEEIQLVRDDPSSKGRITIATRERVFVEGTIEGEPFEGWIPTDEIMKQED